MSTSPAKNTKTQSKMTVTDEVVIEISNMNKWFGHFHVLRDIDLIVNLTNPKSHYELSSWLSNLWDASTLALGRRYVPLTSFSLYGGWPRPYDQGRKVLSSDLADHCHL